MMIIRPVQPNDVNALMMLAAKSGVGLTSLPRDETTLTARIERACQTWCGTLPRNEQGYLFVLEDTNENRVVGVCAIEVAVGLNEPWYSFRVGYQVHASKSLNVYRSVPLLYLSNDHTGYSELCTLFLDPAYRHEQYGKLLSKVRFLFMAAFRSHFSSHVIAEMRGYSDASGQSPFWDCIGRHFFAMEFAQADYLSGTGEKAFIAELIPRHPLYIDFLTPEARQVMGQVHPQTVPARRLLEEEGLRYCGYIDIFDGGPTLEAAMSDIRAVRQSRMLPIDICDESHKVTSDISVSYLVANDDYHHYRALLVDAPVQMSCLTLHPDEAHVLGVRMGETVRVLPLIQGEI